MGVKRASWLSPGAPGSVGASTWEAHAAVGCGPPADPPRAISTSPTLFPEHFPGSWLIWLNVSGSFDLDDLPPGLLPRPPYLSTRPIPDPCPVSSCFHERYTRGCSDHIPRLQMFVILATFMEAAVDPPPPFPMSTLRLESPFAPSHSWMCSLFSFPSDWAHPVLCAPTALLLGLLRQFKKDPASEL